MPHAEPASLGLQPHEQLTDKSKQDPFIIAAAADADTGGSDGTFFSRRSTEEVCAPQCVGRSAVP
jgi:hypothetical protein